ncbi:MAG: MFS transporter [Nanoarchaeota archaeon]|nr:MFS transporter [Nanoarchaeota archaeon]
MKKKKGVIAQSLDNSVKEAGAVSVMSGVGDNFVSPFAIAMNASPLQISLLTSTTNLLAPWFQLHANNLMKKRSRKYIVTTAVLFHALMWLPLAFIPFFFKTDFFRSWSVVIVFAVLAIVGGFAGPVWNSWMGDLVKDKNRGSYFSKRNKVAGATVLITGLFAAWFLRFFNVDKKVLNVEFVLIGFSLLFFIAFIFRLISRYYLSRQYEPKFRYDSKSYFSIKDFMKRLRTTNLGNYVLYGSLLRFGVAFASPFFAVYMLRELSWSYPQYIGVSIASSLASISILSVWGRLSDRFGNVKILIISGILLSLIPLFWMVSKNWYYLLLVNAFGGASWAGFGLAGGNFIYDVVPRKKRSFAFAYNNVLLGFGIFAGATVGGLFATYSNIKILGSVYLFLFLVSGVLRLLLTLIFVFRLKEEREVEEKPIWEIASTELPKGFVDDAFVFVNNAIPRKEAIKEAIIVNHIKFKEKRERLKNRILKRSM